MNDDLCGASTAAIRVTSQPPYHLGPCVLRKDHDGPVHQDANGTQWTGDVGAPLPTGHTDLRDQIEAAIRDGAYTCPGDGCQLTEAECQGEHPITWAGTHTDPTNGKVTMWVEGTTDGLADAAMPVVHAALAEKEGEIRRLRDYAERFPDAHADFGNGCADWCYRCRLDRAEEAEAAVQRVRVLIASWRGTPYNLAANDVRGALGWPSEATRDEFAASPPLSSLVGLADGTDWQPVETDKQRAQRAEAAIGRVRALCEQEQERAARSFAVDYTGTPFPAMVPVKDVLAALDQPKKNT